MSDRAAVNAQRQEAPMDLEKQLEVATRKLAEAHKMASLGRLSAGIVHEINTPIGSILSNNETIRRSLESLKKLLAGAAEAEQPPPAKAQAILDTLVSLTDIDKLACERIYAVIRSLKTFARVSESDLRTVNLHEILQNMIKLSGCSFRRRINVTTDFAEDVPEVECYPGLINQVFLNLVVNAAQAIPDEGTIAVRTRLEGDMVHVSVSDTGTGIPPEAQDRIFSAGFSTKPMGEGSGLGLTITREIVEDTHGGKITFETEMGVGTTFHVLLPIRQPRTQERS
jgi:signal transduction histidine kinase